MEASPLVFVPFQYGGTEVLVRGEDDKVLVVWKGVEEASWTAGQVMHWFLLKKVFGDFVGDFLLEGHESSFDVGGGLGWAPAAWFVEFLVEVICVE